MSRKLPAEVVLPAYDICGIIYLNKTYSILMDIQVGIAIIKLYCLNYADGMKFYALVAGYDQRSMQKKAFGVVQPFTAQKIILLISSALSLLKKLLREILDACRYQQLQRKLTELTVSYTTCSVRPNKMIMPVFSKARMPIDGWGILLSTSLQIIVDTEHDMRQQSQVVNLHNEIIQGTWPVNTQQRNPPQNGQLADFI